MSRSTKIFHGYLIAILTAIIGFALSYPIFKIAGACLLALAVLGHIFRKTNARAFAVLLDIAFLAVFACAFYAAAIFPPNPWEGEGIVRNACCCFLAFLSAVNALGWICDDAGWLKESGEDDLEKRRRLVQEVRERRKNMEKRPNTEKPFVIRVDKSGDTDWNDPEKRRAKLAQGMKEFGEHMRKHPGEEPYTFRM